MTGPSTGFRVPHVYAIVFALILATAVASLAIPPGSYDRDAADPAHRVLAGTYRTDAARLADPDSPPPPARPTGVALVGAVLTAPLRGIVSAADIVAFILVIGGAFRVVEKTGAFDAVLAATVKASAHRPGLLIGTSMVLFSAGGAVFGMSEEVIPFVLLLLPLVRALGYDDVIAVAIPVIGSGVGFAGAMINPFTVGVAQSIAGLPPNSGWEFRTAVWIALTAAGVAWVLRASRRARGGTARAAVADGTAAGAVAPLTPRRIAVLVALAATVVGLVVGVRAYGWYVIEIGALFLALGIVAGRLGGFDGSRTAEAFVEGARDLLSAALVVGLARGIVLLASETRILDTVLHAAAGSLEGAHGAVSLNLMFLFQSVLNFFVPSGSGQAALTMPIMAPLADLVGVSRQMAVLAFQFGDGFSNLIIPTGAMLIGSLGAARVPYETWVRFAWPLQVLLAGFGAVALTVAYAIGYGT